MSGALVALVAKGAQDVYLINEASETSFFRSKFTRYKNFSQAPKRLDMSGPVQNNGTTSIPILSLGDLINNVWLEGDGVLNQSGGASSPSNLSGTIFELYIGGQRIDMQTFDYMADVWQVYMSDTYSKSQAINNNISQADVNFFPLHFFFCDNGSFLPLIAIQYHQIEIRITWGPYIENATGVAMYGNYVFLDTKERDELVSKPQIDMLITQVQRIQGSTSSIDLSLFNHPVKSIFFGYPQNGDITAYWSFSDASIILNGTPLLEKMSPTYFYTVQAYYNTKYCRVNHNNRKTQFTKYFMYNFCIDATSYKPTGTCNFSRLDSAVMKINGFLQYPTTPAVSDLTVYAVNYNILRLKSGISGVLFSN